jgi:ABC-type phosphate transport system ATPase subunit
LGAGKLSGGQQAQIASTLALAKRPQLLVLDEPVASLDPLARRESLNGVLDAVAEGEVTVILSSHIVPGSGTNAVSHAIYQPASFFWTLQLRETGPFTAIAALLILFAAWWTQRQAA